MTTFNIIQKIKEFALAQPNVNSFGEGNIYDFLNANPKMDYSNIFLTQQVHYEYDSFRRYTFNIFYVDRLLRDYEQNRLEIQSVGIEVLSNLKRFLEDELEFEIESVEYHTFTEKFADECAGAYMTIRFDVPLEWLCEEEYKPIIP